MSEFQACIADTSWLTWNKITVWNLRCQTQAHFNDGSVWPNRPGSGAVIQERFSLDETLGFEVVLYYSTKPWQANKYGCGLYSSRNVYYDSKSVAWLICPFSKTPYSCYISIMLQAPWSASLQRQPCQRRAWSFSFQVSQLLLQDGISFEVRETCAVSRLEASKNRLRNLYSATVNCSVVGL